MILTEKFLRDLNTKIGDDIVLYDVAARKVYFIHHSEDEFRLRQTRGKRRLPVKIRKKDHFFRVSPEGEITRKIPEGFVVE